MSLISPAEDRRPLIFRGGLHGLARGDADGSSMSHRLGEDIVTNICSNSSKKKIITEPFTSVGLQHSIDKYTQMSVHLAIDRSAIQHAMHFSLSTLAFTALNLVLHKTKEKELLTSDDPFTQLPLYATDSFA